MTSLAHKAAAARVASLLERTAAKASARPWDVLEAALYAALVRLLADEGDSLAKLVLARGALAADDAQWWQHHTALVADELAASLAQVARLGAIMGRETLTPGLAVNWGLVNQQAVAWAGQHAGELVRGIEPVTRAAIRDAVSEWAASGAQLSDLAARIRGLDAFSEARARRIAQTESTNAFAAGNAQAWEAAGVAPAVFKPAAHPNCRCYLQPYRMADGREVMVWYTAVDERVCTQRIETPWGPVDGCRDLHNVIVSSGPWLGQRRQS